MITCPYHKKELTLEDGEKKGEKVAVCRCQQDKYNGRVVVVKTPPVKKKGTKK